jgi:hypothetical protein
MSAADQTVGKHQSGVAWPCRAPSRATGSAELKTGKAPPSRHARTLVRPGIISDRHPPPPKTWCAAWRIFSPAAYLQSNRLGGMRCVDSCVCFVVISGTSRRTTRLRARSRNVFGAEAAGRRSLVTRDSDHPSRPAPSRPATRATPRAAERRPRPRRPRASRVPLRHRPWAFHRANAVAAEANSRATSAATAGNLSTVLTVGLTGLLIATIGGESGGWINSTMRSRPLMRPAARSVRWCIGTRFLSKWVPGPSGVAAPGAPLLVGVDLGFVRD